MNIVVFGCDNTGKSTLCSDLVKVFNANGYVCDKIHSPGPKSIEELVTFIENNLLDSDSKEIRIFDRFPIIEEAVYGKLLRGGSRFNDEEYNEQTLGRIDAFIYCFPGTDSLLNWGTREQMDGVKENVEDILEEYSIILESLKKDKNVIIYDYNRDTAFDMFDRLVK